MKDIRLNLLLLLLTIIVSSFKADKKEDIILWDSGYKLKWDDFKGKPDPKFKGDALTSSGIKLTLDNDSGKSYVEILTFFDRKKSWVKKNKNTDYLLNHEQKHFDLTEVYALMLMREIADYKFSSGRNKYKEINKLYAKIYKQLMKEQNNYDKETNHSKIKEKQEAWDKKIEGELGELIKYNNSKIFLK